MPSRVKSLTPYVPIGLIGGVLLAVIFLSNPKSKNTLPANLITPESQSSSSLMMQNGCLVDAVGLQCRCVIRSETECKRMEGQFFPKDKGGMDACEKECKKR